MGKVFKKIVLLSVSLLAVISVQSQETGPGIYNVLHINSYALDYPWTDSLVSGIQDGFSTRNDIQLYIEFLDARRFDKSHFKQSYQLFKNKYQNIKLHVIIVSDNDALDFMMLYGDSLAPDVPVIFCGINNPQDYPISNSRYYGILDGVDLKTEINLIIKVMPGIKKLYFISDKSTTSLLNLDIVKALEPEYARRLQFVYIHDYSLDSLIKTISRCEPFSAIALISFGQDNLGNPFNINAIYGQIVEKSSVPVFADTECMLGKGIAGGIFNSGSTHGRETARLALKFLDDPGYTPPIQMTLPKGLCYFDYEVLRQFNIAESALPYGSIIINRPQKILSSYLKYIIASLVVIGLLILFVSLLLLSINRRRKTESIIKKELHDTQEKNSFFQKAHRQATELNAELEKVHEHLSNTNHALIAAKEKSEESDKLKSAFLANMSHQIRTPLNAIIGFSSLLNDARISEKEREEYSRIISSNGDQLLRIIDDILDLSKIEAGQMTIFIDSFSLSDAFDELVDTYLQSSINNQVEIRVSPVVHKNHLLLKSDPFRFRQIFGNLLSNAVKFTRKGYIELGYHLDSPGEITFYVKDTGIGIDKKDLKHLFNRFWKADMRGDKFFTGAGLGLAITKKLCETLGGRIWVESEPGSGTNFYVAFQDYCILKNEIVSQINPSEIPESNLSGFTIAIVEDESNSLYLLTRLMQNLNIEVISFRNGAEIVDYFRNPENKKVHLVLMDIRMPNMDGIMATRLIHEIDPNIPVIAQSAYALNDDMQKTESAVFTDYISKPIRTELLVEKIKKYLHKKPV